MSYKIGWDWCRGFASQFLSFRTLGRGKEHHGRSVDLDGPSVLLRELDDHITLFGEILRIVVPADKLKAVIKEQVKSLVFDSVPNRVS